MMLPLCQRSDTMGRQCGLGGDTGFWCWFGFESVWSPLASRPPSCENWAAQLMRLKRATDDIRCPNRCGADRRNSAVVPSDVSLPADLLETRRDDDLRHCMHCGTVWFQGIHGTQRKIGKFGRLVGSRFLRMWKGILPMPKTKTGKPKPKAR